MTIEAVGPDLAGDVFQVHGSPENGRVLFSKAIRRARLLTFLETLPPGVVGRQACGSSHHVVPPGSSHHRGRQRGRHLSRPRRTVGLRPAGCVKPCVKRGKHAAVDAEAVDAEAIREALRRPAMYDRTGDACIAERAVRRDQDGGPASDPPDPSHTGIAHGIWRSWETRRQAEMAIFEYINGFYNPRRRYSAPGGKSPVAFERKVA
jgi:hypothetical protein